MKDILAELQPCDVEEFHFWHMGWCAGWNGERRQVVGDMQDHYNEGYDLGALR